MKKIIKGRKYDTETAMFVGENSYDGPVNDFRYWHEALFKKRNGEFFLYGEGGGMSQYRSHFGDSYGYGEEIIPMSPDEARGWAENNMDVDAYEKAFGEVSEGGERVVSSFSLEQSAVQKLERIAGTRKMNKSDVINKLILQFDEDKYL